MYVNLLLLALIISTWATVLIRYPTWSVMTLACIGLTTYSVAPIIGWTAPVRVGLTQLYVETTWQATLAMGMAWLGLLSSAIFYPTARNSHVALSRSQVNPELLYACFAINIVGYLLISAKSGPLFFLMSRDEAFNSSHIIMLWRWSSTIGLLLAIRSRNFPLSLYFFLTIISIFIAGDRTLSVLSTFSALIYFYWGKPIISRDSFRFLVFWTPITALFILFGKPIYLFAKNPSISIETYIKSHIGADKFYGLGSLEPMGIHYLLESVIKYDVRISISEFLIPIFSQLLIVPSAFGVSSHSYNTLLNETLFQGVTYGIAFNPWAQAYSLAGYIGVFLFGTLYGAFSQFTDIMIRKSKGLILVFFCLIAATFTIYGHRNSIENILAFTRQIVIVCFLIWLVRYSIQSLSLQNNVNSLFSTRSKS